MQLEEMEQTMPTILLISPPIRLTGHATSCRVQRGTNGNIPFHRDPAGGFLLRFERFVLRDTSSFFLVLEELMSDFLLSK